MKQKTVKKFIIVFLILLLLCPIFLDQMTLASAMVGRVVANPIPSDVTAYGSSTSEQINDVKFDLQNWSDRSESLAWVYRSTVNDKIKNQLSDYAMIAERPNLDMDYTRDEVNEAPNVPVLVQPLDDSIEVGIPPTLEVTVTDPNGDNMDVEFWGRPVGGETAEDFMIIAIPDTQNLAQSYNSILQAQFDWIADRYTTPGSGEPDLVFVTHLGDLVNISSDTTQWSNIDSAFDLLDAGGVPYSVGPGNHDIAMGTTYYSDYFGTSRFTGKSWYGGYYEAGSNNYNNYSLFSVGGMDFILINLQYQVTSGALDWADALLKTHSDRRAIVEQHDILNTNNSWNNQAAYTALSDNPNLFLMLCGHMHSSSDGSAYRLETREGMDPVHILMTDYQDYSGQDYIRLLTFRPSTDEIYAQVFSPYAPGGYLTSASNYEQFTMAYDMETSEPSAYELIGTTSGIASGANASIQWLDLNNNTEYEWYVVINDGELDTSNSTTPWHFTTEYQLLGDVNDDGSANSTDALIILSADVGMDVVSFCPMNCGDINLDGLVNSTDALILLSYDVGISVPFDVGQPGCPENITQPLGCSP